jgi:hypothetical protein
MVSLMKCLGAARKKINTRSKRPGNATAPLTDDGIGVAELFCNIYGLLFFCIVLLLGTPLKLWIGGSPAKLLQILS